MNFAVYKVPFFVFLFFPVFLCAQTGPGGVGNSSDNCLWLRADSATSTTTDNSPVSSWNDVSGNGNNVWQNNAVQRPVFRTNFMNGYPAIEFDDNGTSGQNDFLIGANSTTLDACTGLSIFSVVRRGMFSVSNNTVCNSIVAKRTDVGVNQAYMFFFWDGNYLHSDVIGTGNRRNTNPVTFGTGTDFLVSNIFDGKLATAQRNKIYRGESLLVAANGVDTIPHHNSPLIVGTTHDGDPRAFGGHIAEIIIYRKAVNAAERIIINNYLSAKYNIALDSNDVYRMDDPANGNFDHEVAGIGRVNASNIHSDARGTGIIRMRNPSNLGDDEFLMWGHDRGLAYASNTTDVPAGVEARFGRTWRVSESDRAGNAADIGAVDIEVDLSAFSPVVAADLRLLVNTDGDGVFADAVSVAGATHIGGGIYRFAGVTALSNGVRFTIGTTNIVQTPLPVSLLSFKVERIEKDRAVISWETAMEINNSHFAILKSYNGYEWSELARVNAAGNSDRHRSYEAVDYALKSGINLYKLIQADFDGTSQEIGKTSVYLPFDESSFSISPNPTTSDIQIEFSDDVKGAEIEILNTLGQVVSSAKVASYSYSYSLPLPELQGIYFVRITVNGKTVTSKVVKQ